MFSLSAKSAIASDINQSNIDQAYQLLQALFNDDVLFNGNITGQQIILLGEIAKALKCFSDNEVFTERTGETHVGNAILRYLESKKVLFAEIRAALTSAHDDSAIMYNGGSLSTLNATLSFCELLYRSPLAPLSAKDTKPESTPSKMLYKAKNGELVIRFSNSEEREKFIKSVGQGRIHKDWVDAKKNPQFEKNEKGLTPARYKGNDQAVFCPSYQAQYGEFAVNLTSKTVRDAFVKQLGLEKLELKTEYYGYQTKSVYGDSKNDIALFSIYDGKPSQENAIYFEQSPIFTKPDTFIRITNGRITEETRTALEKTPAPEAKVAYSRKAY